MLSTFLCSLALSTLFFVSSSRAADIEGSIAWNAACPNIESLHPQTRVSLDGGRYTGLVRSDGRFKLNDISPGTYVLDVLARDHIFEPLRVDVLSDDLSAASLIPPDASSPAPPTSDESSKAENSNVPVSSSTTPASPIEVRPAPPGTPFALTAGNPLLAYPIVLHASRRKDYFTPAQGFDVLSMLKNPMIMIMVVAGGIILVLPKLMENLDPELLKDVNSRQDRMFSIQNRLQNGDFSALFDPEGDRGKKTPGSGADGGAGAISSGTKKSQTAASLSSSGKKSAGGGGKRKR